MEFRIDVPGAMPDVATIADAIRAIDPAAVVDSDAVGNVLRVAAALDSRELLSVLDRSGYPVAAQQVTQLPSTCCGGCSG